MWGYPLHGSAALISTFGRILTFLGARMSRIHPVDPTAVIQWMALTFALAQKLFTSQ